MFQLKILLIKKCFKNNAFFKMLEILLELGAWSTSKALEELTIFFLIYSLDLKLRVCA